MSDTEEQANDLSPELLATYNAAYWASVHQIRLQTGPFELYPDHAYQQEPMSSTNRRIVYMKATQGGFTQLEVLKTLHGLIHKRFPQGVLYLFPTADDVSEFSKSRFNPLIRGNPQSVGRFVHSQKRGTDTASLKKIHDAFLYLRGARLSQTVEGGARTSKESSKLRSVPVDRVVFDEVDLMPPESVPKALSRMAHSKVKEEVYISNPTIPGRGIDKLFGESDQRYWHRRCACGNWQSAELTFPDSVRRDEDGRGRIVCLKCGRELPLWAGSGSGEWVPAYPERKRLTGYRWSQLSSTFNDPADIVDEVQDPSNTSLADTYRLRLGLPYVEKEHQLTRGQVFECCGADLAMTKHPGPTAMGVDMGKDWFHVVIGVRTGVERFDIVRLVRVPGADAWGALHDLGRAYNVKRAVLDIRPYEHAARKFCKEEPFWAMLCEYTENALVGHKVDDAKGIIKSFRTGLHDDTHRLVADGRLTLPRRSEEVERFADHCVAMAKVLEKQKRTGIEMYRYTSGGADHYRHALGYFYLAARRLPKSRSLRQRMRRGGRVKNEFSLANAARSR